MEIKKLNERKKEHLIFGAHISLPTIWCGMGFDCVAIRLQRSEYCKTGEVLQDIFHNNYLMKVDAGDVVFGVHVWIMEHPGSVVFPNVKWAITYAGWGSGVQSVKTFAGWDDEVLQKLQWYENANA